MKKLINIFILVGMILFLIGCGSENDIDSTSIKAPENLSLAIEGAWNAEGYEILDNNIASNEYIYEVLAEPIQITSSYMKIGDKRYDGVSYKLKYVNSDYELSYEVKYNLKDLGIYHNNIQVYSITYDNNLLCEIIYKSNERAYLYYQGLIFKIIYKESIDLDKEELNNFNNIDNEGEKENKSSQGILLGLKTEKIQNDTEYVSERYRTIWISTKLGELQPIKEKEKIIFPRRSGIWTIDKLFYEDKGKNIYYEYFEIDSLDSENKGELITNYVSSISAGKRVTKEINYVGNDYCAIEVFSNEKFTESPVYKVLPLDNISSQKGVVISDLLGSEASELYLENYKSAYSKLTEENKKKLSKFVNYSNFTMLRNNGRWNLVGRISPILSGGEKIDFPMNVRPNKALSTYDTLIIPWKVLKGDVPLLVDAFTSPDGSLAIIVTSNDLLIYNIIEGRLEDEPIRHIPLNEGETVILAEWCENEYVSKWDSAFKQEKIIE